jgi:hypothetical protein
MANKRGNGVNQMHLKNKSVPFFSPRQQAYADYVNQAGSEQENQLIKTALQRNQLTGSSRFVDDVESRIGLRVEHRSQGRPRKSEGVIK